MGSYSIFLLIFGVIPVIQCVRNPGEIRSSMSLATTNKHGLAKNDNMTAENISFDEFKSKFNKQYENEAETQKRRGIFQKNVKIIEEHNKLYESGMSSFKMGVNKHADMNIDEIVSISNGFNNPNVTHGHTRSIKYYDPIDLGKEPSSMDWLKYVNPARHQYSTSNCYAFATVGSIESAIAIKYGPLLDLSEQYLVDCDGNSGCYGGWPSASIEHVMKNGIALESGYPYTGIEGTGTCNEEATKTEYNITRKHIIEPGNDAELKNALVHLGPATVVISYPNAVHNYQCGILENACDGIEMNLHAVLLVGYGTSRNGKDYWLLKNSFGEDWGGEDGYLLLSRDTPNHCGISSDAIIPSGAEKYLSSTMFLTLITSLCIMMNEISTN